jgi:hypothetical protein
MNRQLNLEHIRQLLNRSSAQLDEATLASLRETRTRTLERRTERHAHALAFSGHGKSGHWHVPAIHPRSYLWIAGLLLVACIVSGIAYWHKAPSNDTSDVDIAILTDDLPLQVFID